MWVCHPHRWSLLALGELGALGGDQKALSLPVEHPRCHLLCWCGCHRPSRPTGGCHRPSRPWPAQGGHRDQTQTVKQQIFWCIYSNLCQGLAALLVKDFFLLSNLNLPIFRLNPCPRGACWGAPSCQAFGSRAQPLVGHRGNSA